MDRPSQNCDMSEHYLKVIQAWMLATCRIATMRTMMNSTWTESIAIGSHARSGSTLASKPFGQPSTYATGTSFVSRWPWRTRSFRLSLSCPHPHYLHPNQNLQTPKIKCPRLLTMFCFVPEPDSHIIRTNRKLNEFRKNGRYG
jgi:hypothetical protein